MQPDMNFAFWYAAANYMALPRFLFSSSLLAKCIGPCKVLFKAH